MLNIFLKMAVPLFKLGELRARLVLLSARQIAMATIAYAMASILALMAVCGLFGAGYLALAPHVGAATALAIVSVVGLALSAFVMLLTVHLNQSKGTPVSESVLRAQIAEQEAGLGSAEGAAASNGSAAEQSKSPLGDLSAMASMADPKLIAAAGFAAAGLLGPGTLLRMVRFAAAMASAGAVVNSIRKEHLAEVKAEPSHNGVSHSN